MFCKYCGKELPDNAHFCSQCGKEVSPQKEQVKDSESMGEEFYAKACKFARNNNFADAVPLFEKAADLGNEDAISSLAMIYIDGNGIEPDYEKGLKYLHKSVNNGNPFSINYLGMLYLEGRGGVPQDYEQAFISFNIAAEKGYPYAMLNASELYLEGKGTEIDIKHGILCLLDAIDVWGDVDDDGIAPYPSEWQMMAHEQLYNLFKDKQYIPILEEVANDGNRVAQYYLYTFLNNPFDYDKNTNQKEILNWLIKSADSNFPNAQYELGINYHTGLAGCTKNKNEATYYLSKATEQGHAGARFYLQNI